MLHKSTKSSVTDQRVWDTLFIPCVFGKCIFEHQRVELELGIPSRIFQHESYLEEIEDAVPGSTVILKFRFWRFKSELRLHSYNIH